MTARTQVHQIPQHWNPASYVPVILSDKGKILVISRDPQLADVQKTILEAAGFSIIPATDDRVLRQTCSEQVIKLIMLGYSLEPSDKRRVWVTSRRYCKVPILELRRHGKPELIEQHVFVHESHSPNDFLEAVKRALQ